MGVISLSERGCLGHYLRHMRAAQIDWLNELAVRVPTVSVSETFRFLSASPVMRQWVGERMANGLVDNEVTVAVDKFENTIEFTRSEFLNDRTSQVRERIADLGKRTANHWLDMAVALMVAAESTTCYDGSNFFDTDHEEGDSGAQDNDLAYTTAAADVRDLTIADAEAIVQNAITACGGYLDDRGQPYWDGYDESYVLLVPNGARPQFQSVVNDATFINDSGVLISNAVRHFSIRLVPVARLDSQTNWWTSTSAKVVLFRLGGVKPFIFLENPGSPIAQMQGPTSDLCFEKDLLRFGARAERGAGLGHWQSAVLTTIGT